MTHLCKLERFNSGVWGKPNYAAHPKPCITPVPFSLHFSPHISLTTKLNGPLWLHCCDEHGSEGWVLRSAVLQVLPKRPLKWHGYVSSRLLNFAGRWEFTWHPKPDKRCRSSVKRTPRCADIGINTDKLFIHILDSLKTHDRNAQHQLSGIYERFKNHRRD